MNVHIVTLQEEKLTPIQKRHLKVAKKVAGSTPVLPAKIHNTLKIIGAYDLGARKIYITPERLERLKSTMNTTIHELAHHDSRADDGTKKHDEAITRLTNEVTERARNGEYDELLGEVRW